MLDSLIEFLWYVLLVSILVVVWRAFNLAAIPQMINNLERGAQVEVMDGGG